MSKTTITFGEWSKAIDQMVSVNPPGPEWVTIYQLEEELRIGYTTARRLVNKMMKQGKAELKWFPIKTGATKVERPVPHYRLKK